MEQMERLADYRANVVRMIAVGVFYSLHTVHYLANQSNQNSNAWSSVFEFLQLSSDVPISARVHLAISFLVVAWMGLAAIVHRSLFEAHPPRWLPSLSVCLDVGLLTAALVLSTGVRSPMYCGFVLIIMLVALRLNLTMVRWTTVLSLVGLLIVLGASKWPRGLLLDHPLPTIPRHHQLMIGASIILAGLIAGQWVRQTRSLLLTHRTQTEPNQKHD
jgi:hypothetical protein